MKSHSINLGVIVIGLLVLIHAQAWGKDWKLFSKTEEAKFCYDKEDVTHLSQKVVKVWMRRCANKWEKRR